MDALNEHVPLCEVETKVLGFNHTQLGQFIVSHWNLPEHVAAAARYHHASDQYDGPHEDLVHVVALADIFAHLKGRTSLGVRYTQMPSARLFTRLKLREQQVKSIWNQLDQILTNSDVIVHFHVGSA